MPIERQDRRLTLLNENRLDAFTNQLLNQVALRKYV